MTVLWKSNVWQNQYRIFRDKLIVGILKKNPWKDEAYGEFNGAMLRFRKAGFWKNETIIFDIEGVKELGKIEYGNWAGSAKISYKGQSYDLKYDSWMRSKWMISSNDIFAKYATTNSWKGEGSIEVEGLPPEIVLTGLFIDNRNKAIVMLFIVIMIPILAR